jgi:hypothetical protein
MSRAGHAGLTDRVWLRSPEEEDGPVRVYRPAGYSFPPARGREGVRFDADGGFAYIGPGAADVPGVDDGTWCATEQDTAVLTADVDGQVITLRIIEVTGEILRLEWTNT